MRQSDGATLGDGDTIGPIARLAARTERRLRTSRALDVAVRVACGALAVAAIAVALRQLGAMSPRAASLVLVAAAAAVVVAAVVAWAWRLPSWAGARALDRHHRLHDRLTSALEFAGRPPAERTPFMEAAIADAASVAPVVRPSEAAPIRVPRALPVGVAMGLVVFAATFLRRPSHVVAVHAQTIEPVEMAADDLDDVKEFLKQIEARDPSGDQKAAVEEFNRLVDDIANRRLDRTEAFRRLAALEQKLLTGSPAEKKALEQRLEAMGEELKKSDLTRPAGAALANDDLAKTRDALHDAAQKLRSPGAGADKAKLEAMRDALKKAVEQQRAREAELRRQRDQLADDLLKSKRAATDGGTDEEESLLKKKQDELDRLDRELSDQKSADAQLDRLDRELEQAAEDLMKDLGLSADDLDRSAEDINHMNDQQMSQQEKEELRQKLQELRELLRQQGQGGKSQMLRLKRFARMARGQQGQGGQGGGESGQGQDSQGGQGENGQGNGGPGQNGQGQGQGNSGQPGGQDGQAQRGQGSGGETWIVGPDGQKILMLSRGSGAGSQSGGQGQGGQGNDGRPGRWGDGHDPNLQGKATAPKMGTVDTQVQGSDGQGGSRSQVILGAAERGFASRKYGQVYTEYHQVAEESLAKDEIPGGYRFYVKRYFELIRPRDTP